MSTTASAASRTSVVRPGTGSNAGGFDLAGFDGGASTDTFRNFDRGQPRNGKTVAVSDNKRTTTTRSDTAVTVVDADTTVSGGSTVDTATTDFDPSAFDETSGGGFEGTGDEFEGSDSFDFGISVDPEEYDE